MPYIKKEAQLLEAIDNVAVRIRSKGELNFVICELVGQLISKSDISYTNISNWISSVHDAECELRRRLLDPYEDKKMKENGDVPSFKSVIERMRK